MSRPALHALRAHPNAPTVSSKFCLRWRRQAALPGAFGTRRRSAAPVQQWQGLVSASRRARPGSACSASSPQRCSRARRRRSCPTCASACRRTSTRTSASTCRRATRSRCARRGKGQRGARRARRRLLAEVGANRRRRLAAAAVAAAGGLAKAQPATAPLAPPRAGWRQQARGCRCWRGRCKRPTWAAAASLLAPLRPAGAHHCHPPPSAPPPRPQEYDIPFGQRYEVKFKYYNELPDEPLLYRGSSPIKTACAAGGGCYPFNAYWTANAALHVSTWGGGSLPGERLHVTHHAPARCRRAAAHTCWRPALATAPSPALLVQGVWPRPLVPPGACALLCTAGAAVACCCRWCCCCCSYCCCRVLLPLL